MSFPKGNVYNSKLVIMHITLPKYSVKQTICIHIHFTCHLFLQFLPHRFPPRLCITLHYIFAFSLVYSIPLQPILPDSNTNFISRFLFTWTNVKICLNVLCMSSFITRMFSQQCLHRFGELYYIKWTPFSFCALAIWKRTSL